LTSNRTFLTAEWRNLVLLNYEVDSGLLSPFVPRGTELDSWNAKTFISLVGFQFLNTKILGTQIPFHTNFDEVNLRFYVRRLVGTEMRRGVVFIREIVPCRATAFLARVLYNEKYVALPMAHTIEPRADSGINARYRWKSEGEWCEISFESRGEREPLQDGSEAQFIAEHYWGYAKQRDDGCVEYQVTHPSWKVWHAARAAFHGRVEKLYGPDFAEILRGSPASAFLADGSEISVMRGHRL
jgi:uncharacterized protein